MSLSAAARLNELLVKAFDLEDARSIVGLLDSTPFDVTSPEYRLIYIMVAVAATVRGALVELGGRSEDMAKQAERILVGIKSIKQVVAESLEEHIATMFTQALDAVETEVRTMAREMAQSEYRAASALTAQAIGDQVEGLSAAARRLEAQALVSGGKQTVAPAGTGSGRRPWYEELWVVVAVTMAFGVVVGVSIVQLLPHLPVGRH
jgi:hypothetical protein